jgi:RecA-family ATPase
VLDLTAEPPPVKWLVDGMICHGDIHLLIGEPGIGKSWLTMALALAIAGGSDTFLGRHVSEHGRVLYLDEENPEDLVYSRLTKLGLNEATAKNIRYISNEGVNFAKHGDEIIEEAFDFEPELTIIDSLTRFHNEDENNAGSMAGLFNDAIKPLARQTGSAVVLIHHVNKTDSTSSYKRSRGSGDIPASIDSGYDVREVDSGVLAIANFKSRRSAQGDTIYISIKDTPDGRVELTEGQHIPF